MQNMSWNWLGSLWPYLVDGMIVTLIISIIVVVAGFILGTLLALMKLSKWRALRWIATIYSEIFRGTPMLVQIMIGFVLISVSVGSFRIGILTVETSRLIPGIIVLSMNSGAYVSETIRGGINSVSVGQVEAATSLGMKPFQAFMNVVFPQALRNVFPAIGNEFVTIIKDSSLLQTIGIMELWNGALTISTKTYQGFSPLLAAAILYLILTVSLTRLLAVFEKRMNKAYGK